jgi:hypothetical protein
MANIDLQQIRHVPGDFLEGAGARIERARTDDPRVIAKGVGRNLFVIGATTVIGEAPQILFGIDHNPLRTVAYAVGGTVLAQAYFTTQEGKSLRLDREGRRIIDRMDQRLRLDKLGLDPDAPEIEGEAKVVDDHVGSNGAPTNRTLPVIK